MSAKRRTSDSRALPTGFRTDPAVPPLRLALLSSAGGMVEHDVAEALAALGHQVMYLRYRPMGGGVAFEGAEDGFGALLDRVLKFGPHAILCVNLDGLGTSRLFAGVAEAEGVPLVCWFVDTPPDWTRAVLPPESPLVFLLTYDRSHLTLLREWGYRHVEHLPLATSLQRFALVPSPAAPAYAVAYVGNLFLDKASEARRRMAEALAGCDPAELALCDALLTEAVAALAKGEAATETAWQWLAREATGRFATVERAADHEVLDRWLAPAVSHLATAERRRAVARALDGLGLHVWGRADDWQGVVPPDRLHAPVPYGSLAAVYRAAAVNVSIGHAQNVDSATQRLFDVPACGGFLLSDWRPSMADLFAPGEELVAFHSPGEARELAARYLADAPARQAVARRARERVVAAHTYCHRVEWIAREILERWPGLASRPHPRKTVAMSSPPALAAEVLGIVAGELVRDGFERPATRIAEALATVPEGRAASLTLKGHRAMASGNAATALAAYEASLAALRDASGATQFAAACATERLHGPAAALPLFGEAARLRPADAVAWTSLAACHLQLADWPRARHALERALRIAPDYVPALQCRAAFRAELEAVAPLDDEGSAATKSI